MRELFRRQRSGTVALKQIKDRIRDVAARRKNVRLVDIEWVVGQLALHGFKTRSRNNGHQTMFSIDGRRFGVCTHHAGSSQIKSAYVDRFLEVMIDLGLYDEED